MPIRGVLGLAILDYGRWLCAVPLTMAGWCAPVSRCSCRLACKPFIPQPPYAAGCTMSVGFILAPPPYRMVNAGSCDYKKKKKKKKKKTVYTGPSMAITTKTHIQEKEIKSTRQASLTSCPPILCNLMFSSSHPNVHVCGSLHYPLHKNNQRTECLPPPSITV